MPKVATNNDQSYPCLPERDRSSYKASLFCANTYILLSECIIHPQIRTEGQKNYNPYTSRLIYYTNPDLPTHVSIKGG